MLDFILSDELGNLTDQVIKKGPKTPIALINKLLPYTLIIAGLVLFAMIIIGGFKILTSGGNQEQLQKGRQQLTQALIGFIIVFAAYWIAQILEVIFNFPIISL